MFVCQRFSHQYPPSTQPISPINPANIPHQPSQYPPSTQLISPINPANIPHQPSKLVVGVCMYETLTPISPINPASWSLVFVCLRLSHQYSPSTQQVGRWCLYVWDSHTNIPHQPSKLVVGVCMYETLTPIFPINPASWSLVFVCMRLSHQYSPSTQLVGRWCMYVWATHLDNITMGDIVKSGRIIEVTTRGPKLSQPASTYNYRMIESRCNRLKCPMARLSCLQCYNIVITVTE